MVDKGAPSLRIDWFDGSLVEDTKPSTSAPEFPDDGRSESTDSQDQKPTKTENKAIGFKRLLDISLMEPDKIPIEVTYRPGFWNLFDQEELKGDFIVLIVKILEVIFKNIQLGEANSKMLKSLETRFLPSNFLEMLTRYIEMLPNVKIVEKRMNTQLWDDVETFFFKTVSLCEGIILFPGRKSEDLNGRVEVLLRVICESAIGVIKEHSESIRDDLFDKILKLQNMLKDKEVMVPATVDTYPTDSFKNMSIFPTLQDLLTPEIISRQPDLMETSIDNNVFQRKIEPVLDQGAYPSVEHYLDVQFRLLREDYIGPLREGICKYLENPSKTKHANIRVYNDVEIIGEAVNTNKVGDVVEFQKKQNRQLMFGSQLLFTSDKFRTILCATVHDLGMDLRGHGCFVKFQNPILPKNITKEKYLMIESEVFFEPYHQVLKVLQSSRLDDLPMKKYIVDVKPETQPPAYLTPETKYTIEASDKSEITFPVLDTNLWPIEHIGLDNSQLEAYKFALTHEFAVIQGPPGTGKTFLGVKIATTILKNISLEGTPMLVICYTNHALDQFLEGILNVTDNIIRLGSQSKSQKLEPYTLNNVKARMKCSHPFFHESKKELDNLYKEIGEVENQINTCDTGILRYKHVKPYLKIDEREYDLKYSDEDRLLTWLFEHLEDTDQQQPSQEQKNDEKDDTKDETYDTHTNEEKLEVCFSKHLVEQQIEIMLLYCRDDDEDGGSLLPANILSKVNKLRRRIICFKTHMEDFINEENERKLYDIEKVDDLYDLSPEQRWQMYFNAVNRLKGVLEAKMGVLSSKHKAVMKELDELTTQIDSEVVSKARVVGLTTTAAARRHQLIIKMRSPIVIVEEAAEVLEAHIIASLTFSLQHLILIGDHKQLRPTAANYKLAKECNMEISLFERMIRNGIHSRTLDTQRRMRPNFVELLVPEIYPKLDSHESVTNYPNVKGMKANLFFLTHEIDEDSEAIDDSRSHENNYEANWCVYLARYLLKNGHAPEEMTMLATYSDQVTLIQRKCLCFERVLRDVKVTTVDNFQGEESKIVLLSLVRSNRDGKIGFLAATNRICVALSRAKEGFYIFGNMTMLSKASPIWMSIKRKLTAQDTIGELMPIDSPVQTPIDLKALMKLI